MIPPFEIISTGSQGNAVVLNKIILIDCGVCFKKLEPYYHDLKLVLLTHIHSDHFHKTAIKMLASERPTLRFACGKWLESDLLNCGVPARQIDVIEPRVMYDYGACNIISFPLSHDVPNCGWKIHFPQSKIIYATDTVNLNGVSAPGYDLYLIEANYEEQVIWEKIREKEDNGEFAYERRVLRTHLAKSKCDDFLLRNCTAKSEFVYMHCHRDEDDTERKEECTTE